MKEPWDQLENESNEAYSHFLIYRNLGVQRTLRKTYLRYLQVHDEYTGGIERLHVPGNWRGHCMNNFWKQRATSWDIRNLHAYGARLAILHTQAVTKIAEKAVRLANKLNPGDKGWQDLLDSVSVVQGYLTPEVVRGIAERNQSAGPAPQPAQLGAHDDGIS